MGSLFEYATPWALVTFYIGEDLISDVAIILISGAVNGNSTGNQDCGVYIFTFGALE